MKWISYPLSFFLFSLLVSGHANHLHESYGFIAGNSEPYTAYTAIMIYGNLSEKKVYEDSQDSFLERIYYSVLNLLPNSRVGDDIKDQILDEKIVLIQQKVKEKKYHSTHFFLQEYFWMITKFTSLKSEFHHSFLNKAGKDILVFDSLFDILSREDQLILHDTTQQEVVFIAQELSTSKIIDFTLFCDGLNSSLKYSCYKPLVIEVAARSQEEVDLFSKAILAKYEGGPFSYECHFMHHQLGNSLATHYGEIGASTCPPIEGECSQGCYHGLGEYFANFNTESLLRALGEGETFEFLSFYHGTGHNFFVETKKQSRALDKCDGLSPDSSLVQACYSGVFHQLFTDVFVESDDFFVGEQQCKGVGELTHACYSALGANFAFLHGVEKGAQHCSSIKNRECIEGVGDILITHDENVSKVVEKCNSLFLESPHQQYCYYGALENMIFYLNITNAFLLCGETEFYKEECYASIERIKNSFAFYNKTTPACSYVNQEYKEKCFALI